MQRNESYFPQEKKAKLREKNITRKQYLLLWVLGVALSLINTSVVSSPEYIHLGKQEQEKEHEHEIDHIGQMEQPLSVIQIHNTVFALTESVCIEVEGPRLLGSPLIIIHYLTFYYGLGVQLNTYIQKRTSPFNKLKIL